MSSLRLPAFRLLAALLLADGALVSRWKLREMMTVEYEPGVMVVASQLHALRKAGVTCFETVSHRGVRMTSLPPDEMLDDVLMAAHEIKPRMWFTCQRMAA